MTHNWKSGCAPRVTLSVTANGLRVEIKGSHVPSLKNRKRIAGRRLITEPRVKAWMDSVIDSIVSQLLSGGQTVEREISATPTVRSRIALLPPDDNLRVIPEIHLLAEAVAPGEEGAIVEIELLP